MRMIDDCTTLAHIESTQTAPCLRGFAFFCMLCWLLVMSRLVLLSCARCVVRVFGHVITKSTRFVCPTLGRIARLPVGGRRDPGGPAGPAPQLGIAADRRDDRCSAMSIQQALVDWTNRDRAPSLGFARVHPALADFGQNYDFFHPCIVNNIL